jgi:glycosyltransferase involved in cell wall biosynthesis
MKKSHLISIIIIVKNDPKLEATLNRISKIIKPEPTEIIVVDASKGKLDYIKNKFKNISWIDFQSRTNKGISIPEQRNEGIIRSKGDIVVFIDSSCYPSKSWLVNLTKPIIDRKEDITAGLVKTGVKRSVWDVEQENFSKMKYLPECSTINMAFRKNLVKKVGYFDEFFRYGSDMDFSCRLIYDGYKIRYIKEAVIYTDWGDFKQDVKRAINYGEARVKLYKKHLSRWRNLFGSDLVSLAYAVYIILLPLTLLFPYYPLLIIIPILKNITKNPIKTVMINLIFGFGVLKELLVPTTDE